MVNYEKIVINSDYSSTISYEQYHTADELKEMNNLTDTELEEYKNQILALGYPAEAIIDGKSYISLPRYAQQLTSAETKKLY